MRRAQLDLLRSLGFGELQHDSHVPFLSHLIGTRRVLASWGSHPALCDAGLFHSVYGTEYFETPRKPERDEVAAIIGPTAERLAWLWCNIERRTLDAEHSLVRLRSGENEQLAPSEVVDLVELWAADTVEQVERMTPDERGFADGLLSLISLASDPAQLAVEQLRAIADADALAMVVLAGEIRGLPAAR